MKKSKPPITINNSISPNLGGWIIQEEELNLKEAA